MSTPTLAQRMRNKVANSPYNSVDIAYDTYRDGISAASKQGKSTYRIPESRAIDRLISEGFVWNPETLTFSW